MLRLPTSQKETVTIPTYNIHIVHVLDMFTSWTTHPPPLQNTTLCRLLERQPTVIYRGQTTTFMGNWSNTECIYLQHNIVTKFRSWEFPVYTPSLCWHQSSCCGPNCPSGAVHHQRYTHPRLTWVKSMLRLCCSYPYNCVEDPLWTTTAATLNSPSPHAMVVQHI